MKLFLIRDRDTGLYYQRRHRWVEQARAAVWTHRSPVNATLGAIRERRKRRHLEVVVIGIPAEIVLVTGGDWEGLYIDGELRVEGHSLTAQDALECLGYEVETRAVDQRWLEQYSLPKDLLGVKVKDT